MTIDPEFAGDDVRLSGDRQQRLESWYAQGFSDGLGDRLLMFDNTRAPSWELLRLRPEFMTVPGFETAVRERVTRLARFHHPSFPTVRAVEEAGAERGLKLASTYVSGRRLSDALDRPRSATSAARLIRELTPALADLQEQGEGIAHGVLAVDRIVLQTDGRFVIREHVLGSALQGLGLSATRLWVELGIVVPSTSPVVPRLDGRADIVQLALVALSLMIGRRAGPGDYAGAHNLLEQLARTAGRRSPWLFIPLQRWLERALQLNGAGFKSARHACDALSDIPEERQGAEDGFELPPWHARPAADTAPASNDNRVTAERPAGAPQARGARDGNRVQTCYDDALELFPSEESRGGGTAGTGPAIDREHDLDGKRIRKSASSLRQEDRRTYQSQQFADSNARIARASPRVAGRRPTWRWVSASLLVVVIGEAAFIAERFYGTSLRPLASAGDTAVLIESPQGADVLVDGRAAGVTPLQLRVGAQTRTIRVVTHQAVAAGPPLAAAVSPQRPAKPTALRSTDSPRAASQAEPSGRLKLSSAIAVDVFEDGRLLGSAAQGLIVATAGRHELELVNSALGYRSSRVVHVGENQVISIEVEPANGRLSINANPWAQVWLNGRYLGETPLANLSVPLGEHQILFRHPQLGERSEKAIVRSEGVTRVSANLQP